VGELAAHSTFLETADPADLGRLAHGRRPSLNASLRREVQMHRRVSFRIRDMMKSFPSRGHPIRMRCRAGAASPGPARFPPRPRQPQDIVAAVVRLIAKIPTMVAAFQLIRKGQDPIQPRDDSGLRGRISSTCSPSGSPTRWRRASSTPA
jgi:citrate synthase